MDIYERLGVRTIVNATGFATELGGAIMAPEVVEAMAQAARSCVQMRELHEKAGRRIAELVGVEAACVASCAAAGLCLAIAACITGKDPEKIRNLPQIEGDAREVVIQAPHRSPFDHALRQTGARLVVAGTVDRVTAHDIRSSITHRTVAVAYVHDTHLPGTGLDFDTVASVCGRAHIPLVVDAAAELPPATNLRVFLKRGADLVVISGGKGLRGPQASGLILGRRSLVEACVLNGAPNADTIGRAMKVGKEEIAGLVAAVELYVAKDHQQASLEWEASVQRIISGLADLPGAKATRVFPMGKFRPIPLVSITVDPRITGRTVSQVVHELRSSDPPIIISHPDSLPVPTFTSSGGGSPYGAGDSLYVKVQAFKAGDEPYVIRRLREVLAAR